MPAPKVRTDAPGVYQRGTRFMAVWRDQNGKQHTKTFLTFEGAVRHRRDAIWKADRARFAQEEPSGRSDPRELQSLIRRAAQQADRLGVRDVLTPLYDAEDAVRRRFV